MGKRIAQYHVEPLILNRWSPRAMSGESISDEELFSLFEAARWAPSSYNSQPWRFLYAKRDTPHFQRFFDLLVAFNQSWCKTAAVLLIIVSRDTFEYNNKQSRTAAFCTGSAWQNLALQGYANGLVVHGMEGFDYERAHEELAIPDGYSVQAMAAIGRPGNSDDLPEELREKEVLSDRKPIVEFVSEGVFKM